MVILGIAAEHNSAACLMIDGTIVGMIQEERFTRRKNQVALPLRAIQSLIDAHLGGDAGRIDRVVYGGEESDPYYTALDKYGGFTIEDHIREMHELWHPHFYGGKRNDGSYWAARLKAGYKLNPEHNFDLGFLDRMGWEEAIEHFGKVERPAAVRRALGIDVPVEAFRHHLCHAYYGLYGAALTPEQRRDALVLTADAWGDGANWSASVMADDGRIEPLGTGHEHAVGRIYKFVTLILGMKPNEHEYKVMGLASYSVGRRYIEAAERVFFEALDFRDGRFVSERPLRDSYFDLRDRLEGHRFDNVAAAVQNWSSQVTCAWARHWLKETGKRGICFSGGLSMNIKANGDLAMMPEVDWLSVPASGGDESLCAGACFAAAGGSARPLAHVYLGDAPDDDWSSLLEAEGIDPGQFAVREGVDAAAAARLIAADCIVARCVGPAEFGARALGNRSILANPSNPQNVKIINEAIKNRDFWMPFTPSMLAEHADRYLENPKRLDAAFMTIGFASRPEHRHEIVAALHPADYSARPQMVHRETNPGYWALIEAFRRLTGVAALLNTSLNLHGEPMNYSLADAARTVALSELDFLLMPADRLLYKRRAGQRLGEVLRPA